MQTIQLQVEVKDDRSRLAILRERRAEILAIAAHHGADQVRVFGSVARGEEGPESDVDFLVSYDPERVTPWFPGGLLMDWEELLGCRVDVLTEEGISPLIRERVLAEAKLL
ncbi:nucleotidyltransferase family protein [Prochlorothrix hollandica]|uniref:DNA polymerase subunit beta n=1 Tax=Prochlorothrix hollandica PCC 9006 = CALU 1027 TaxID=317619 RepID=A0A0M2PUA4_PROHO|nr:nucleotidyltransferase domain-containing protein [Prochlorothrix hollandica]KKJ00106.1 DNA polymerase subunit beta [Prochlorothrix hollandica PCC 9006 = CALU 1027]